MGTIAERISASNKIRYRVIVKELCSECYSNKQAEKSQIYNCNRCKFLRYNNVTDLIKFQIFLDSEHNTWDWWNVYNYIKGEDDKQVLAKYRNLHKVYVKNSHGNWIYTGKMERNVPCRKHI